MIRPRRILLDECMHLSHQSVFPEEFEVSHVEPEGWKGTPNGQLPIIAHERGFEIIITEDQGFIKEIVHPQGLLMPIFVIAGKNLIAHNFPSLVPALVARMNDGMENAIYFMGIRKKIRKVVGDLPPELYEIVPTDYAAS